MITTHIAFLILTIFLIYNRYRSIIYCNQLSINLSIATQPAFKEKLNNQTCNSTINKAANELQTWVKYTFPLSSLNLLNVITIWILISCNINLPLIYTSISAILGSLIITKSILLKLNPPWLIHWSNLLTNTKQEIELEFIHQRLNFIKQQLTEFKQGKHINERDLNALKYEGLFLANWIQSNYK